MIQLVGFNDLLNSTPIVSDYKALLNTKIPIFVLSYNKRNNFARPYYFYMLLPED